MKTVLLVLVAAVVAVIALAAVKSRGEIGRYRDLSRMQPMCLGIPGEVIELCEHEDLAVVAVGGTKRMINIGLLDGLVPGDWVLVHLGFALERVEEKTAKASLDFVTGRDGAFGDA